jgi:hypothetical protein
MTFGGIAALSAWKEWKHCLRRVRLHRQNAGPGVREKTRKSQNRDKPAIRSGLFGAAALFSVMSLRKKRITRNKDRFHSFHSFNS